MDDVTTGRARAASLSQSASGRISGRPGKRLGKAVAALIAGLTAVPPASFAGSPVTPADLARPASPFTTALSHGAEADGAALLTVANSGTALGQAINLAAAGNDREAYALSRSMPTIDRLIVEWLLIRDGASVMTSSLITRFAREAPGWPTSKQIRARAEQALQRENPTPQEVIAVFNGNHPETADGARLLARALVATGQTQAAANVIRYIWVNDPMSEVNQRGIITEFGKFLTPADNTRRAEMLLYAERAKMVQGMDSLLPANERAYVDARAAVVREAPDASRLMAAVPADMRSRPGYKYSLVQLYRRAGQYTDAAKVLISIPADKTAQIDPSAWWDERKMVSRKLLDQGDYKLAYQVVSNYVPDGTVADLDAEFHAGWYALRFLNNPKLAIPHFTQLAKQAQTPISRARGYYWLGRAYEAAGDRSTAANAYKYAASYGMTYYGQLARARLGLRAAGVGGVPQPSGADKSAFERSQMVQAIQRMAAVGAIDKTMPLFTTLAETMKTPGEVTLLARLAEKYGKYHFALSVAKTAQNRGLPVGGLAFPTAGIPRSAQVPASLERPVVYAIARQESVFNPGAVSPAGARGLLQLMPATAKLVAGRAGLPYSAPRLTADPAYNATLGAYHLDELVSNYDGSYIMTFAGYNAGPGRVKQWVQLYGDPRDPRVDAIDWVERIPYTETRNYVQRVMENVQVYREQLGSGQLTIDSDLKRGGSGG